MTQSTLPDNWQELLAGYVLGDLDAAEVAQVQQWLATDPDVAAELAALQAAWGSLPDSLVPLPPPPRLRSQVLAAVPPAPAVAPPTTRRRTPALWGLGLGWAVTAIALGAVVVENQQLRQEKLESEAIVASFTAPQNRLVPLAGTDTAPTAQARLVIDAGEDAALMATAALAPLPADEVYRLWAVLGETPTYCGEFNPAQTVAVHQWTLPDAACETTTALMLVTREQIDAPPTPQGDLVLQPQ